MKGKSYILRGIYNFFKMLFFSCAVFCLLIFYNKNYNLFTNFGQNISFLFIVLIFMLLTILMGLEICKLSEKRHIKYPILLYCVLIGFTVRIAVLLFLDNRPVSDFLRVYNYAALEPMDHSSEAFLNFKDNAIYSPYYGIESITMRIILKLMGGASYFKAELINVAMSCSNSVMIYLIAKELFDDSKAAFLSAAIYIFMPVDILHDSFLAHENYCIFFSAFFIYFILKAIKTKKIYNELLAGIFLGFINLYKPIAILYIASFILVLFFKIIEREKLSEIKYWIRRVGILWVLCIIVTGLGNSGLERYLNAEVHVSPYKSMLMGLTTKGDGMYSQEIGDLTGKFINESKSVKEFNRKVFHYILQDWKANYKKLPKMFASKFAVAWGRETEYLTWATFGLTEGKKVLYSKYENGIAAWILFYNAVLYILCIIAVKRTYLNRNISIEWMTNIILLMCFMLLLTETQARYKSVIFIPICITAGYGLHVLKKKHEERNGLQQEELGNDE